MTYFAYTATVIVLPSLLINSQPHLAMHIM